MTGWLVKKWGGQSLWDYALSLPMGEGSEPEIAKFLKSMKNGNQSTRGDFGLYRSENLSSIVRKGKN